MTTSSSSPEKSRPFRVIVAGGGVGGLVISHALTRLCIDHVVLERGVVAPDWGASISIWANGARILQQIGCWDAILAASLPLKMIYMRGPDGKAYSSAPYFDMMMERNGYEYVTMERRDFLRIIYENHPDPSCIKEGKRVVDVVDTDEGVSVKLDDGTVEEGDLLVGCDGVHSTVRELMWRNANASIPGFVTAREKTSLVTTYRALVGVARPIPGLGVRDMHWVTHWGMSFLILSQPDKIFFFINWKLPQKMTWPSKARWTDDEAEAVAATVANLPISESIVFGKLWKNKIRAHLLGLQEGIFDHWSFGRLVIVGDSAHKVTPNLALGAMCALESSAVLVNKIKDLANNGKRPSKSAISAMLSDFQDERMPRQAEASWASAQLTRLHAYDGWWRWVLMRWAVPYVLGQSGIADTMADLCSRAPKMTFLPVEYGATATFKWPDEPSHVPVLPPEKDATASMGVGMGLNMSKGAVELLALLLMVVLLSVVFGSGLEDAVISTTRFGSVQDGFVHVSTAM